MLQMRSLLWIDSIGGLVVGAFVLLFARWLSPFYGLTLTLVVVMGIANVAYGSFSFSLARRAHRPLALIKVLVVANALWSVVCAVTLVTVATTASVFGLGQLALEGLFVGGLAALEWRHRALLVERDA